MNSLLKVTLNKSLGLFSRFVDYSAILMLHRVGIRDPGRIPANQNMVIEPEELDIFIVDCKKTGWSFISLDELATSIQKRTSLKKTLILTFDDGYLDNLLEAAPVLVAHAVPFAVYVSSGFIESEEIPWWYKLEAILASCRKLRLPDGPEITADSLEEKQAAFLSIRQKIMASGNEAKEYKDWLDLNGAALLDEKKRLFMNWDEVHQLANLPNATIGAHTHSHPILSRLSDDEAFQEVRLSKEILENKLARPVRHFAYPFGGAAEASEREFQQIEALGFETAVTTRMGAIDPMQIDQYALPRCFYRPGLTLDFLQNQLFEHKMKSKVKRLLLRD